MSKRVKILISVAVAILLLAIGATAMVMAQEEPTPPESGAKGLLARVAEILGIPEEELVNAFKQAQQELREEAFTKFLDKAVEEGLITQEEADQIKEWWEQRPEAISHLFPLAHIFPAIHGRQIIIIHKGYEGEPKILVPALHDGRMWSVPRGW